MQRDGENFMRRAVDVSELYDFIKSRKDCWFVSCDIVNKEIPDRVGNDSTQG